MSIGGAPSTLLAALASWRFPLTNWLWRALAYLLSTPVAGIAALPLVGFALPWLILLARVAGGRPGSLTSAGFLVLLGAVLTLGLGPLVAVPVAELERWRLRLVRIGPVRSGHRHPPTGGPWSWLRTRYTEPVTWRELGYAGLLVAVAPLVYAALALVALLTGVLLTAPLLVVTSSGPVSLGVGTTSTVPEAVPYALVGLVLAPGLPYLVGLVAAGHAAVARALLTAGVDRRLWAELHEVTRSRARLVDAFEAERRRIERDLHDGAQQRLIGLTVQLGLARLDVDPDSPAAAALARAHDEAKRLMAELRELIRGIQPPVLTDRGLPAALRDLADRCPLPMTVTADLPGRLPAAVEAAGYFVAAEAVTNAVKHSGAAAVRVTARREPGDLLTVEVRDDGRGGADPAAGTGLVGLADRVAVVGGRMLLSSPAGGPTVLRVEIPCHDQLSG